MTVEDVHSSSTQKDLSAEHTRSGLNATDSSQSVTNAINVSEIMQSNSSDAILYSYPSGTFSNHTKTSSPFDLPQHDTEIGRPATWEDKCDVTLCKTGVRRFVLNTTACSENENPKIRTNLSFTVSIMVDPSEVQDAIRCYLKIAIHKNHYLNVTVEPLADDFTGNFDLHMACYDETGSFLRQKFFDSKNLRRSNFFLSLKTIIFLFQSAEWFPPLVVTVHVDIKEGTYMRDLPFAMLSDTVGYVMSPGFENDQKYPNNYDGYFQLNATEDESVLVNFVTVFIASAHAECVCDYVLLVHRIKDTAWRVCHYKKEMMAYMYHSPLDIHFHTDGDVNELGFKMKFAILPMSQEPPQLSTKLFNCSVPSFPSFKYVFSCNMLKECEGGEDEQDCSHRSNDCGVEDAIHTGTTCYSLVLHQENLTWFDAHKDCIRRRQKLATLENPDDFRQFKAQVPPVIDLQGFFVGAQLRKRLQSASTVALYRNIWQWVDGRTVFSVQIHDLNSGSGSCTLYDPWTYKVMSISCHEKKNVAAFICEFDKNGSDPNNLTRVNMNDYCVSWNISVVKCPSDHVTRDFLSCDFMSDCDASYSVTSCSAGGVTVPMFVCQRSRSTVHYTLVCDHMQHCPDNSDEDFCKYPDCSKTSVKCQNGQCIQSYQQCDGKVDCYDGSDEVCHLKRENIITTSPPGSIHLDGRGNFLMQQMNDREKCPLTHFYCPRGFCLPVYLRCNGVDDCVGREDEIGCNSYRCHGFYRCRGSKTCLHPEHVCDNITQCPQQDDEMLCNHICPDQCHCQGLAFVCPSNFSASSHLLVRYLDASGSNMTLNNVRDNILLIGLRLSKCHIIRLPLDVTFLNLRELDLSWNKLHRFHMQYLRSMKNLKVLLLTGNPLVHITNAKSTGSVQLMLERVDLSDTNLEEFSGSAFASSAYLKVLNFSRSKLKSISEDGFHAIPRLESLDLRVNHLTNFPKHLLKNLTLLKTVYSQNYKLCCEAMLPVHFHPKNCLSTQNLLASCEDLLKYNFYRICLWIFASLSLVGNMFSVVARLYQQREGGSKGSFSVFVTSLSVADLFMGIYLAIIGSADLVYRGRYLWLDKDWMNSAVCKMAGFLCLVSSETSAFIICLITLDRFLVLRFPFSRLHLGHQSAVITCGVVWAVGILLAAIPLLPLTSHWKFYSQTGICIPLPFTTRETFRGYDYSFGVSILLNLVLFLLIAVGQVVVFWAVRTNSMPSSNDTHARDAAIARRLITVVVSDFLCWFPIGLLGLLASTGTPIPGELNVTVATIVLPVNSALNPFLYTFNLLMEKRRKAQNEQLLKRLQHEINLAKATNEK